MMIFVEKQGIIRSLNYAEVAELADALDLKSNDEFSSCRFESGPRHQFKRGVAQLAERTVWDREVVGAEPATPTRD